MNNSQDSWRYIGSGFVFQAPRCNHAEKAYAKIAALRRIKRLVTSDVMIIMRSRHY